MRRLGFSLLILLLLAACSSAPQRISRSSGGASTASNGAWHTTPPGFPNFVDHSVGREEISIQAMSLVGIPYRWGGNTPDSGFDCSGLVRYVVARSASVNLPRTTADMSGSGESIDPDEVAPGDLIFFNTTGRPHSHVGIYVGKLRFVNAPSTGGTVRIDYLTNPYWAKRFDGIRRVAAPTHAPTPFETPTYQASNPSPQRGAPVPTDSQAAYAGAAQPAPTPVAASADAFEPPPSAMSAAQTQAREAGAVTPANLAVEPPQGSASAMDATAAASAADAPSRSAAVPASVARAPDPIDAAADAFEPPPPASVAARQEQQVDSNGGVQIMRASTHSRAIPAPTQSSDDPIAHFANGNF
ncbi:hypothetical protein P3T43_001886 [Paraburkholderia sp. GAS41]|jgi:hypothetical protein|uniref:C40 family peptidase n=1 Tax=Paraburkholderia sp. GAS41 TaxID=3035134 RepID=UPI003D1C02AE